MSTMWTGAQVTRIMERERAEVLKKKLEQLAVNRGRVEATRVVHEAMRLANIRYVNRLAEVKRDMELGLIGPEGQPHKQNREAWLAAEVRYSLLKELNDESPIKEEEEL